MRGASGATAKPRRDATHSLLEQRPEVEGHDRGAAGNRGSERVENGARVTASDELVRPGSRDNSLESESRTRLRGETNPRDRWRSNPPETCETSGAERCWPGTPAARGLHRWTSRRGAKPHGRQRDAGTRVAGLSRGALDGTESARADEPGARASGDGEARNTARADRKR